MKKINCTVTRSKVGSKAYVYEASTQDMKAIVFRVRSRSQALAMDDLSISLEALGYTPTWK
jgi:hypothetical protein